MTGTYFVLAGTAVDPNEPNEPDGAKYVQTGYCSQCGQCCRAGFINKIMCLENNFIDGVQYCDFVERKEDGKFYCLLIIEQQKADAEFDISKEADEKDISPEVRVLVGMTDEQIKYCCSVLPFPAPSNSTWRMYLRHKDRFGISKCTFSFERR